MRHLGKIGNDALPFHVLTDRDLERSALSALEHIAKIDRLTYLVRNFDAHIVRTRDRCEDTHTWRRQCECDVVSEIRNAIDAHTRGKIDLEERDRRAGYPPHHIGIDAEIMERIFKVLRHDLERGIGLCMLVLCRRNI